MKTGTTDLDVLEHGLVYRTQDAAVLERVKDWLAERIGWGQSVEEYLERVGGVGVEFHADAGVAAVDFEGEAPAGWRRSGFYDSWFPDWKCSEGIANLRQLQELNRAHPPVRPSGIGIPLCVFVRKGTSSFLVAQAFVDLSDLLEGTEKPSVYVAWPKEVAESDLEVGAQWSRFNTETWLQRMFEEEKA